MVRFLVVRFLLAAIRALALFHQRLALFLGDQTGALEFLGRVLEVFEIYAVILPRPVARAKILDAATLGIDERVRRRRRTLIEVIGHSIVVAVHRLDRPLIGDRAARIANS